MRLVGCWVALRVVLFTLGCVLLAILRSKRKEYDLRKRPVVFILRGLKMWKRFRRCFSQEKNDLGEKSTLVGEVNLRVDKMRRHQVIESVGE